MTKRSTITSATLLLFAIAGVVGGALEAQSSLPPSTSFIETSAGFDSGGEIAATQGVLTSPMQIEGDHILVPNGNGNFGDGRADFRMTADTDTTVNIKAEIMTPSSTDDSFFVWFDDDDSNKYTWHTGVHTSFGWATVGQTFTLTAGSHVLHIGHREDGAEMRKLKISAGDAVFGPVSGCAFSDLVLPSGASASGPNCTAGGTVAHGAGCTVSSPDHSCSSAQCTDGSWTSPTCFLWKLQNLFTCSTQGSNCDSWWGATQRAERGYTCSVRSDDACGLASKMLFPESPYDRADSPVYDAMGKGYTMQKPGYENGSPNTGTKEVNGLNKPQKYGSEQDPIAFSDTVWLDTGGCVADAPSCVAGFNYDPMTSMCADSASGWDSTTPASACGYAQHKCDEFKIYYAPRLHYAVLPLTATNQAFYETNEAVYAFTYVFKKWMECTAKNVTATSSGTAANPDGWDCEVEKRCVCLSCTMGSLTDTPPGTNTPGDIDYTGEPCSCDAAPESVQGKAGLQCAQT